jgi:hypothetical protein
MYVPSIIKEISQITVDMAKEFVNDNRKDTVAAILLTGKYMTLSYLDKKLRVQIDEVSNCKYCPLCALEKMPDPPDPNGCINCTLYDKDKGFCNYEYTNIKKAVSDNYMATAFALKPVIDRLLIEAIKGKK